MDDTDGLTAVFVDSAPNTHLSWLFVLVLAGTVWGGIVVSQYEAALFGLVAIVIVTGPTAAVRDPSVIPPWYFLALICLPILWEAFVPIALATAIVPTLSLATLGLLLMVEIHHFTRLRLAPWFTVVLTVLFTLALAALLNILRWSADVVFGTSFLLDGRSQDAINTAVMLEFVSVTVVGILAGLLFRAYFRRRANWPAERTDEETASAESVTPADEAVLTERLGVSPTRQRQLTRAMQAGLGLVIVYGAWTRQLPFLLNAGIALAITFIPVVIERDYGIPIEPGLTLWVTSAVFLHVLGSAGLYGLIPPWDLLTHTLSATVVAAAGYTTLRAIHLHASSIHLPPWAMFAFTLVFVLAMGVVWELLEFAIDRSALVLGLDPVLAQHGINDTIVDLLFDAVGAVVVATWGTVYLVTVSEHLAVQLEGKFDV